MRPVHEPQFSSATVARAAGITPELLKEWVSRHPPAVFLFAEEREQFGRGRPIQFSFQRAMQVKLTATLVAYGFQPRRAALHAGTFTDLGSGGLPDDFGERRDPCELYPNGHTLLLVHPNQDSRVVRFDPSTAGLEFIKSLGSDVLLIHVDLLYARLARALGE